MCAQIPTHAHAYDAHWDCCICTTFSYAHTYYQFTMSTGPCDLVMIILDSECERWLEMATLLDAAHDCWPSFIQGFQLSHIERESPVRKLFLPLSRQASKISHVNEKIPSNMLNLPHQWGKYLMK